MLSTRKTTTLDWKYEIPGQDRLLKHERKLTKLWKESRDPAHKTAVNWVTQNSRRMVRKRALERWQTAIWRIVKSLMKRGGPKAPSAIHGPPYFIQMIKPAQLQTA
jgi:hypothetical protein